MNRNGFMLIEFLIYLSILTVILLAVSGLVEKIWIPAMKYTNRQTDHINLVTAHDCFIRDIKMAKAEKKFWKRIHSQAVIFKSGWRDVGWEIKKENLIRSVGNFNEGENKWEKHTQSLIIKKIDHVEFTVLGDPEVTQVRFRFAQADQEVKTEIALINGTLPWKIKKTL